MRYEFVIIGAGVAGIFAALELKKKGRKVLIIDKGKLLEDRACPADQNKECNCDTCDKYVGFGGLGLSEGKFNYTNDFGGDLERKVGYERALELMNEVDNVLTTHGANRAEIYSTYDPELTALAQEVGFGILSTRTRHLGTDLARMILQEFYEELKLGTDFYFQTEVHTIIPQAAGGLKLILEDGEVVHADTILLATGRSGNEWLAPQCDILGIERGETRIDLGLRIEMRGNQLNSILSRSVETKLYYEGNGFSATTYCMNPRGRVVLKKQEGLAMPDGQNYREQKDEGTSNLNFTLFVPSFFPSLAEADRYLHDVVGKINRGRSRIAAQRLRDLRGISSSNSLVSGLEASTVIPTLEAEFTDLRSEVPELYVRATLEFLDALKMLIREPIDNETILYAMDAKMYSPGIKTDERFETQIPRMFAIGDCSGTTHSLSQAAASGLYVGRLLSTEPRLDKVEDG